jgi:hypothetical protein
LGASLAENIRVDQQLAKAREGGKRSVFKEQYAIVLVYCHLLNQEYQALPICTFSIVIQKPKSISDAVLWMAWIGR